jgi:hypothetical protein
MALYWFLAGMLTTLALLTAVIPWLRTLPRFSGLPVMPWQATVGAVALVAVIFVTYPWIGRPAADKPAMPAASTASDRSASAFGSAAKAFGAATSAPVNTANTVDQSKAGSMDAAIAALESRLAKGGGTADDWELLAKSFEFLGRPAAAAEARAHQLPALTPKAGEPAANPTAPMASAAASGTAVSGEVTLAPALSAKAAAGETLFIVAKSVDAPGIPVAVYRGSVGTWPLKFTLDDSQSMLPGRNLSSAGRVTIEARISKKGQPLPAPGDLQGSTGVIDPADHRPLKILIDRVIT